MEITIRPISDEADYTAALALANVLFDAEPGTPDGDHLDILVTRIEAYEDRRWPIDAPDPIDAIRVRMAEKNLRARDLEEMIGSRGRVSEILSRERPFTPRMIRHLGMRLGIPAEVLIQQSPAAGLAAEWPRS
ncbi:MAG TPA: transcriptional regulator [Longimicrobium sp.]|nr:transcriptional regulator [Longimicrobium sp.]